MMSEINNINNNYPNLVKYIRVSIESFLETVKSTLKETSNCTNYFMFQIIKTEKLGYNLAFL